MTTELVRRYRCDAPFCTVVEFGTDKGRDLPDGWTAVSSTEHIAPYDTPRFGRGSRAVTWSQRQSGSFRLHLCPEHPAAFDGHRPRTSGTPGERGRDDSVTVGCECGAQLGWARVAFLVGHRPSLTSERKWFAHLPVELRWYARRTEAVFRG